MTAAQSTNEYDPIRRDAVTWVREAGLLAKARFGHAVATRKADKTVVTDADHAVQGMLLGHIGEHFSADAVISEEAQAAPGRHRAVADALRCWVVDPIDGTRSFARTFPGFSVSVALCEEGLPVVGLVYNPLTDQMYSAARGAGAWLDGQRLAVRDDPPSADSLIAIPSATRGAVPRVAHTWIDRMVLRNVGSTALHMALVAAGALDAAFADECRLWDIAAGAVLLEEAGARLVSLQGGSYFPMKLATYTGQPTPFLAGGPGMVERLLAEYRACES